MDRYHPLTRILGSAPRFVGTGLSQIGQIGTLFKEEYKKLKLFFFMVIMLLVFFTEHPCLGRLD